MNFSSDPFARADPDGSGQFLPEVRRDLPAGPGGVVRRAFRGARHLRHPPVHQLRPGADLAPAVGR